MRYGYKGNKMASYHSKQRPWLNTRTILLVVLINFAVIILYFTALSSPPSSNDKDEYHGKYAYITFANNDAYAKGALALAMSLIDVGSFYPLVVMVTNEVSAPTLAQLEKLGCIIHKTNLIQLPPELSLQTERWGPAFTKLVAWDKTEFSKLMFLDSDLLILQSVDDLFHDEDDMLLATVDADASSCSFNQERLKLINSGVLVLTPSKLTYQRLIQTLHNKTLLASGTINDQDVVVNTMPWEGLPYPIYGAQVTHCDCGDIRLWDYPNTKIIHFTAGLQKIPKPWDYKAGLQNIQSCLVPLYQLWAIRYTDALAF